MCELEVWLFINFKKNRTHSLLYIFVNLKSFMSNHLNCLDEVNEVF